MKRVRRASKANNFSVNFRISFKGRTETFENDNSSTFSQNESVAISIERATYLNGREGSKGFESRKRRCVYRSFCCSSEHSIATDFKLVTEKAKGFADRV